MKLSGFIIFGLAIVTTSPLRADAPGASGNDSSQESRHLKKEEGKLERMQANRRENSARALQAQEEFRAGTAELSGHDEQQFRDVQRLRSVEGQVSAGRNQENLTRQAYKDAVQKYGSDDPKSAAARQSFKESRQAMGPLLRSRRSLKQTIHDGRLRVHNDKTVLSVQKRSMDSDARYGAEDDRNIEKKAKNIADDQRAMALSAALADPSRSKLEDEEGSRLLLDEEKPQLAAR